MIQNAKIIFKQTGFRSHICAIQPVRNRYTYFDADDMAIYRKVYVIKNNNTLVPVNHVMMGHGDENTRIFSSVQHHIYMF
jgi:hypothetical protein